MGRVHVWLFALFAAFALGSLGCGKASVEKVCEKHAEADEMEECISELTEALEECADADAFLKCALDAEDKDAAEPCFESCIADEEGEEGEGE